MTDKYKIHYEIYPSDERYGALIYDLDKNILRRMFAKFDEVDGRKYMEVTVWGTPRLHSEKIERKFNDDWSELVFYRDEIGKMSWERAFRKRANEVAKDIIAKGLDTESTSMKIITRLRAIKYWVRRIPANTILLLRRQVSFGSRKKRIMWMFIVWNLEGIFYIAVWSAVYAMIQAIVSLF